METNNNRLNTWKCFTKIEEQTQEQIRNKTVHRFCNDSDLIHLNVEKLLYSMETKFKVKVVIVYPNSEYITHWQTDKNTMLNCQNVSTVKKMLYCSGFWTYVLETVRNFSKNSTRNSSLLYISAIAFFVSRRTVIWKLLCTNIRWPPTSHSSTNGIARISAYWNGMQKTPDWMSSLQAHFPFPSPTPPPLLSLSFFLFSPILAQMSLFAG